MSYKVRSQGLWFACITQSFLPFLQSTLYQMLLYSIFCHFSLSVLLSAMKFQKFIVITFQRFKIFCQRLLLYTDFQLTFLSSNLKSSFAVYLIRFCLDIEKQLMEAALWFSERTDPTVVSSLGSTAWGYKFTMLILCKYLI